MEEEHSTRQYNFGGVYWPRYSRSDSIASGERTIQSSSTASGERTVWSHIVPLRGSVLCSHYTSALQSRNSVKKETRTRSRRTNSAGDIWPFRILIDLILWQGLVRSEKLDSALAFDALLSLSISRSSPAFHISLAYLMDFLQPNRIGIGPLMSQEVPENPETQWCYQIMMWPALSSISHYSDIRYLLHDVPSIQF